MLANRLKENLKSAMKSGDQMRVGVFRYLLSEIHNQEKVKQAAGKEPILNDDEIIDVLRKEAKKRNDAVDLFRKGGRIDLVEKEEGELSIIKEYLPAEASEDEIIAAVDDAAKKGQGNFGAIMNEAMKKLKGRADGRVVSEIVKKRLSPN